MEGGRFLSRGARSSRKNPANECYLYIVARVKERPQFKLLLFFTTMGFLFCKGIPDALPRLYTRALHGRLRLQMSSVCQVAGLSKPPFSLIKPPPERFCDGDDIAHLMLCFLCCELNLSLTCKIMLRRSVGSFPRAG